MTPDPRRPRAESPASNRPAAAPEREHGRRMDRYDKSELEGTGSDYLCVFCYDLLYVKDGTAEEACFNRACPAYVDRGEFSGDTRSQGWVQQAKKLHAGTVQEFYKFDRSFLFRTLFEARAHECEKLFHRQDASVNIISSVDYLLTRLNTDASWGDSKDFPSCLRTMQEYYKNFDMLQIVESHSLRYHIICANENTYTMKYHHVMKNFHKTLGILSGENRHERSDCYSFNFIDRNPERKPIGHPLDFEAICKSNPTITSQLNHVFKMGHKVSKIHRYPARPEDFAALLSAWTGCFPNPAAAVDEDLLREIYNGASQLNKMPADFDQFLEDYASGHKYAPILIFDGKKYHFAYYSLLLYLLYLFSCNKTLSGTQKETGQTTYNDLKKAAAHRFEEEIRQKLCNDGFDVHPAPGRPPLRMSFDNARVEFDCIAVDRAKKIVVLVEAKYEDISPSSKAGTTMVDQIVLDKRRGLLAHAKRHHRRSRLFRRHFASLKNFGLALEGSFCDYAVHTVIVTKHEPLISQYMGVDIVSHKKFESADFRGDGASPFHPSPLSGLPQTPGVPPRGPPPQGGPAALESASAVDASGDTGGEDEAAKRQGHVNRGDNLFNEGRYNEAYALYKLASMSGAPDATVHLKMAHSMTRLGLSEEALEHYRAAIKADPASAAAHTAMGRLLSALGRHAEALPHYLRTASLDPRSAQAHHDASFSLYHLERYEEALRHAEKAAEIAPEDPLAHERVSTCLYALGRHEEAIPPGHRAIEAAPGRVDSYMPLLILLQRLGRHEEILHLCSRAVNANRSDPRPHFVMALSLRALGRQEEALPHCLQAVKLDPAKTDFRTLASYLLRDLGRFGEALPHCEAVASARPDDPRTLSNMGGILAELGRHEEALVHLDRAIRIEPTQAVLHYNRALSLQATGRLDEALGEYKRAAELDPGNVGAHNNAGIVLAELGRDDAAVGHFDAAIELEPNNFGLHCNKAFSLQNLKMHREALAHFDRAVELNPGNSDAYVGRLSCLSELGLPDEEFGHYAEELLVPAAPPSGGAAPSDAERREAGATGAAGHAGRRQPAAASEYPNGERTRLVESLLTRDESEVVEFKSWLGSRLAHHPKPIKMEDNIAKELCGFLNTKGGDLVIGVGDDGRVEGLASGGRRLGRKERGEMLEWMANVIVDYLGASCDRYLDYKIVEVHGLDVLHCAIDASTGGPVILKKRLEGRHEFFVRVGNTCRPPGLEDALSHVAAKWPNWSPQRLPTGRSLSEEENEMRNVVKSTGADLSAGGS